MSIPDFSFEKLPSSLLRTYLELTVPHTESSTAALVLQFLAAFGNVVGRSAYVSVEADKHYCNLYVSIVGNSAKGRKGTSWGHVRRLFEQIDKEWASSRIAAGLSSGEGLCSALASKQNKGQENESGSLLSFDSRLMVVESEFAAVLKVQEREGNTLSPVIRNAWDKGDLSVMTRKDPLKVQGAHVSIIGHITKLELEKAFRLVEMANGFGNRFLWAYVQRSKLLPRGGQIQEVDITDLVNGLKQRIHFAKNVGRVELNAAAFDLWDKIYIELSQEKPGIVGMMLARAEPQILRISMILALIDHSREIMITHLKTAYDIWNYCAQSIEALFGGEFSSAFTNKLAEAVKSRPDGLTRSEMFDLSGRHVNKAELESSINALLKTKKFQIKSWVVSGRKCEKLIIA